MKRPLLLPLVPLYAAGLALRELRLSRGWEPIRRLRYPVISIGNLSTGGSGKTPLTITLARLLSAHGLHVDVLSRGYGRSSREPAPVVADGTAEQYGDEPLLIARETGVPVYVAAKRYQAGQLAEAESKLQQEELANASAHNSTTKGTDHGAGSASGHNFSRAEKALKNLGALAPESPRRVHILDDGFQHRQLARDLDILLVNHTDWRDSLLPAGNLREPLAAAKRAHILAIPSDEPDFEAELRAWGWTGPVWRLHRRMQIPPVAGPVAAFCGIARPGQFFAGLKAAGLSLVSQSVFADHHRFTPRDVEHLIAKGRNAAARAFLATDKDFVRLGKLAAAFPAEVPLHTVRLTVEIEDESASLDWLATKLAPNSASLPL